MSYNVEKCLVLLYTQPDECPGGQVSRNHYAIVGFDKLGHFFVFVFYNTYYQFIKLLNQKIDVLIPIQIRQAVTDELKKSVERSKDTDYLYQLLYTASYSHFLELIKIDDDVKRNFYELLILKTTPNVKELQRQINTLTFERLGFSGNHKTAFEQIKSKIKPELSSDIVKTHYFFEFLEINYPQLIGGLLGSVTIMPNLEWHYLNIFK